MKQLKFKIISSRENRSDPLFTINISFDKWDLWYKEQSRRFRLLCKTNDRNIEVFDIDECNWVSMMSLDHFNSMCKFLFDKIDYGL